MTKSIDYSEKLAYGWRIDYMVYFIEEDSVHIVRRFKHDDVETGPDDEIILPLKLIKKIRKEARHGKA